MSFPAKLLHPNIRCAQCDKPVDRVEWLDDRNTKKRVIRAYCHGEWDEMTFSPSALTLDEANALLMAEGVAFKPEPVSLMIPRSTTYLGPWCCEKGEALHVRVCPECAEISAGYQSCLGVSTDITESEGGEV